MNLQLEQLGSQSKTSVSVPDFREKPNLAFKTPTYRNRDSRLLSTRQGGFHNSAIAELILFFLVSTVKIYRVRTKIDMTGKLYSPVYPVRKLFNSFYSNRVINILSTLILIKILLFLKDLSGVYPIATRNLNKFVLPPE